MANKPTISAVLRGAADLIEPNGKWRAGMNATKPFSEDKSIDCLGDDPEADRWGTVSAIYAQRRFMGATAPVQPAFLAFRRAVTGDDPIAPWAWDRARSQAGDVAELRRVADELEQAREAA